MIKKEKKLKIQFIEQCISEIIKYFFYKQKLKKVL